MLLNNNKNNNITYINKNTINVLEMVDHFYGIQCLYINNYINNTTF